LSQKGLAAAEEIIHVFVPNALDHLADDTSANLQACISSLVIHLSHIYQEIKPNQAGMLLMAAVVTQQKKSIKSAMHLSSSTHQDMILSYLL